MAYRNLKRRKLSRREFLRSACLGAMALTWPFAGVRWSSASEEIPPEISLEVKIGQMFMVGFRGLEVDDTHRIAQDIRERHLVGWCSLTTTSPSHSPVRNIELPEQLRALVSSLQTFASIPLLVATDQEGGKISRLKERFGFPPTVSHEYLGVMDDVPMDSRVCQRDGCNAV